MKKIIAFAGFAAIMCMASCSETSQTDNTTQHADTMVIKENRTDDATTTISNDTTQR